MILLIAVCLHTDAIKFAEDLSTVAIINVKKNVILEAVESAIKHLSFKNLVHVENTTSKCWLETLSSEKVVLTWFQFAECPAVKNYNAVTLAHEVAMKELVQIAKLSCSKHAHASFKWER